MTVFNEIIDWLQNTIDTWILLVINVLPDSPFKNISMPVQVQNILGYVNYFIPIAQMLSVMVLWLGCLAIYYAYSIVARWIKLIH